jgi:hypothetical protein
VSHDGGSQPADDQKGFRDRLSAFLKWSKPYRDVIALAVAIVVAISGAVSWAVAHFATQAAVSNLECQLTHQMTSHVHDAQAGVYAAEMDARQSQVQELSEQNPPFMGPVSRLLAETQNLKAQADSEERAARDQLNDAIAACKQ